MVSSPRKTKELQDVVLASDYDTITWTTKTTTVEETVTVTRNARDPADGASRRSPSPPSSRSSPPSSHSSPPSSRSTLSRRESIAESTAQAVSEIRAHLLVPDPTYTPPIPHPDDITPPTTVPRGYYVIIVGQEVGIFYRWAHVAERTLNISGSVQSKYPHFEMAKTAYTEAYNSGSVRAVPIYGGPFWRMRAISPPSSPSSSSDGSLWDRVDDLSVEMSQVSL
ncbi:hypothetical protein BJ138DRAFT_1123304 [Hygrophoropsis aurantiaca]|uniref:Uncharacterized protein n=1 Tax=Hygrophoropsis aurantiaca TaxID=72124 RepID=A0ACB8AMP1_9AGAM|nr:hypothetical protein BJ138DRAFT_1123304 [Hygrophoropsis aurantiaca]